MNLTDGFKFDACLMHGDCLELMNQIPDKGIDMILCDLPYGVLNRGNPAAKWDSPLPLDELWKQYTRIIKDNGAIVLFGSGMFTASLMMSQRRLWRYNLIWDKIQTTGFLNANRMPLRRHEDVCVFYKRLPAYNPQMIITEPRRRNHCNKISKNSCYGAFIPNPESPIVNNKFPDSIIRITRGVGGAEKSNNAHPTQKPVPLLEWLIRSYTQPGELVLDNCCGSGSTGVACLSTGRRFIGMELDDHFYKVAADRLEMNDFI